MGWRALSNSPLGPAPGGMGGNSMATDVSTTRREGKGQPRMILKASVGSYSVRLSATMRASSLSLRRAA